METDYSQNTKFQFKYGDRVRVTIDDGEREGDILENYPLQLEPCYNVRYPDGTYSVSYTHLTLPTTPYV